MEISASMSYMFVNMFAVYDNYLMMSFLEAGTAASTASSERPSPYTASRGQENLNNSYYLLSNWYTEN